ncbi:DUF2256 domain-containing protein [Aestuariivirga sp.]|uniref:DUF2256 domain-containing protein n=1 Tax=Aestuariivirga sp. TaxID=2650926 RepID=UPI003BAD464B
MRLPPRPPSCSRPMPAGSLARSLASMVAAPSCAPRAEAMARMRKKDELPSKLCAGCGKPFAWRKKWARDWENVKACSDRCRTALKQKPQ